MRLGELSIFLFMIENVLSHIYLKGDCDATEVFRNAASLSDWSSCIAFKNRNDECGNESKPPVEIYFDILNKTENVSSSKDDKFECIVNCGEGFQQRKLINSDNCTAIQFRSCWVGTCSRDETAILDFSTTQVSNQCLKKMQTTQEKFYSIRASISSICGYGRGGLGTKLEKTNMEYEVREKLYSEAQVGWSGCKSKATDKCKATALDYVATVSDIVNDEEFKNCFDPILEKTFNKDDFFYPYTFRMYTLGRVMPMKEALKPSIDRWISSCKKSTLNDK